MEQHFQKYLIISCVLHLLFLAVFMYGLPSIFDTPHKDNEVMVFDMIDASDFNNIKNQRPTPKDLSALEDGKRVVSKPLEPIEETKPEEPKPEDPKPAAPDMPQKNAEIVPEQKKIEEPAKDKPKPKEIEKKNPKPKEKKDTKKDKQKKIVIPKDAKTKKPDTKDTKPTKITEDPLDKIMRELEMESEGNDDNALNPSKTSNVDEGKFAHGNNYDETSPLSVTEISLIKKQIQDNYKVPIQAIGLKIEIILSIKLSENGTLLDATVKNLVCPSGMSDVCDLVQENALRAVKKASPLQKLRLERYDIWKHFSLRFNSEGIM